MATYNLSGSSLIELTPTIQHSEAQAITFSQTPRMLKRTIALTATDYWRYQESAIVFRQIAAVVRVGLPRALRAVSTISFEPNYHNVQHIITRQWPLTGASAFTFAIAHVMGRTWKQIKNHGIKFSQTDSKVIRNSFPLTGSNSLTFAQVAASRHSFKGLGATSAITFTSTGTTRPARNLSGANSLVFGQVAALAPTTPTSANCVFTFTQLATLSVTKKVNATTALTFTSGGYAIV